jgi:alpha-L-fucosidase
MAWQTMEFYAFVHFNMNTFTNMEWGTGGEKPELFDPSELDARQWAKVAKEAGMKGIIITAKHHDGFCLWPTKTTEHSVKNSPWKNGQGDVLKDLAEACAEYGLKMGVYLSPWDRNHADYGKPAYVAVFHEQLRELLTDYGEVFEVWFDGANGGSGYYGGANETRNIDSKTYYQWEKAVDIVRKLQPNAVIFSDGGPDIRWVGNEEGWANETNWSIMRRDEIYPGWPRFVELRSGHIDGTHWLPAEADVSIRPGWYYHPREDHQVKSLPQLLDIYYKSVGRNAAFLLNLPVDTRGLVHETDVQQLMALRQQLDLDFATDLAKQATCSASEVRGNNARFSAENINDSNPETYWAAENETTAAMLTIAFEKPTEVNRVILQEYIPLGQRVQNFIIEVEIDGRWKEVDGQTTIGYKRILRFDPVTISKLRLNILKAKGPPAISNISIYRAPTLLVGPKINRSKDGTVRLQVPDKTAVVYYTVDGTEPNPDAIRYEKPFTVVKPATVKAIAYDPKENKQSQTARRDFDMAKKDWKIFDTSSGSLQEALKIIDGDPNTFWASEEGSNTPQEVVIDLGKTYPLIGFTYMPNQDRYPFGIITQYEFSVSNNGLTWQLAKKGEFANIVNSRLEQRESFNAVNARFIKLKGLQVDGKDLRASFAEIGVLTR